MITGINGAKFICPGCKWMIFISMKSAREFASEHSYLTHHICEVVPFAITEKKSDMVVYSDGSIENGDCS